MHENTTRALLVKEELTIRTWSWHFTSLAVVGTASFVFLLAPYNGPAFYVQNKEGDSQTLALGLKLDQSLRSGNNRGDAS
jgi:hypothetical protein